jgi:hypothetical protein
MEDYKMEEPPTDNDNSNNFTEVYSSELGDIIKRKNEFKKEK